MAEAAAEGLNDRRDSKRPGRPSVAIPNSGPRYTFRLACAADDSAIRQLLRDTPMQGPIRLSLCSEPSYFGASGGSDIQQTLVVTDRLEGKIVGIGARSVRLRYVDGRPTRIGYLSGLRILAEHRGGTLLARGFREMRRLHDDGATEVYLTTIVDGNRPAAESLARRRASMPTYHLLGSYHTFVLPLSHRGRADDTSSDLDVRSMIASELPTVVEFLQREGKPKLFFPCYQTADFVGGSPTFPALHTNDIITAWRGQELVGVIGMWNQMSFKQCVVEGYSPWIGAARPLFNCVAGCAGWPKFPAAGATLPTIYAAFPTVKDDDPTVLAALLRFGGQHVQLHYPSAQSILIGAFHQDPMIAFLRKVSLYRFVSNLFLVYWDPKVAQPESFRDRNVYMELGCL